MAQTINHNTDAISPPDSLLEADDVSADSGLLSIAHAYKVLARTKFSRRIVGAPQPVLSDL